MSSRVRTWGGEVWTETSWAVRMTYIQLKDQDIVDSGIVPRDDVEIEEHGE